MGGRGGGTSSLAIKPISCNQGHNFYMPGWGGSTRDNSGIQIVAEYSIYLRMNQSLQYSINSRLSLRFASYSAALKSVGVTGEGVGIRG